MLLCAICLWLIPKRKQNMNYDYKYMTHKFPFHYALHHIVTKRMNMNYETYRRSLSVYCTSFIFNYPAIFPQRVKLVPNICEHFKNVYQKRGHDRFSSLQANNTHTKCRVRFFNNFEEILVP